MSDEERVNVKEDSPDEPGAYLFIINRHDAPDKALEVYVKLWRIEVFYRAAKQELGFEKCHSASEAHQHAHMELLFSAETLLTYALWQVNKEKTDESHNHREMGSRSLPHSLPSSHKKLLGSKAILLRFFIEARRFASLISAFWLKNLTMTMLPIFSNIICHIHVYTLNVLL